MSAEVSIDGIREWLRITMEVLLRRELVVLCEMPKRADMMKIEDTAKTVLNLVSTGRTFVVRMANIAGVDPSFVENLCDRLRVLAGVLVAETRDDGMISCQEVDDDRQACIVLWARTLQALNARADEMPKTAAVTKDRNSRNTRTQIPRGRPSVKPISLEIFDERARNGVTLPTLAAEAREVRVGIIRRTHKEKLTLDLPALRTVQDHIRENFAAHVKVSGRNP